MESYDTLWACNLPVFAVHWCASRNRGANSMAANPGPSGAELNSVENRWIFTSEQLSNTPSRKCGLDNEKESNYRQQAASLIQDMGQKLQV